MLDVRLAGEPGLPGVRAIRHLEGAPDRSSVLRREVFHTGHEVGERHVLYECRA
jgi:hypothetical protein